LIIIEGVAEGADNELGNDRLFERTRTSNVEHTDIVLLHPFFQLLVGIEFGHQPP
jgi:hypothetical protein